MGWEREYHHISLDEGEHVIGLVERGVLDRKSEPTRYLIQIKLGHQPFGLTVGHHTVQIKLGGDLSMQADGTLRDSEGNIFDPKQIERDLIEKLNAHHEAMRTYARIHRVPELKAVRAK